MTVKLTLNDYGFGFKFRPVSNNFLLRSTNNKIKKALLEIFRFMIFYFKIFCNINIKLKYYFKAFFVYNEAFGYHLM